MNNPYDLQIKILSQISSKLASSEDVEDALADLMAMVVECTGQLAGWIYLYKGQQPVKRSGLYLAAFYSQSKEIDIAMVAPKLVRN